MSETIHLLIKWVEEDVVKVSFTFCVPAQDWRNLPRRPRCQVAKELKATGIIKLMTQFPGTVWTLEKCPVSGE